MKGAFDEASLRLARALRRPPEVVEAALQEVGVDAPYLARSVVDGDPQGAIDAVSLRLGVAPRELVGALLRSGDAEDPPRPAERAAPDAHADAVTEFVSNRLPAMLARASLLALLGAAALGGFAALSLVRPELFRALLVYAAAAFLGLAALGLLLAAWRMHRAARALRRLRPPARSTKR